MNRVQDSLSMRVEDTGIECLDRHRVAPSSGDGTSGTVDVTTLVPFGEVFPLLQDLTAFRAGRVDPDTGTIEWPNGADLTPETLYLAATGQGIPK